MHLRALYSPLFCHCWKQFRAFAVVFRNRAYVTIWNSIAPNPNHSLRFAEPSRKPDPELGFREPSALPSTLFQKTPNITLTLPQYITHYRSFDFLFHYPNITLTKPGKVRRICGRVWHPQSSKNLPSFPPNHYLDPKSM